MHSTVFVLGALCQLAGGVFHERRSRIKGSGQPGDRSSRCRSAGAAKLSEQQRLVPLLGDATRGLARAWRARRARGQTPGAVPERRRFKP